MALSSRDLVLQHGAIAEQEAFRFRVSKLDRSDLIQAGFVGLLVAAARFDPTLGPFEAYARLWVRKEMQRAIASAEFAAVVPAQHIGRVVALRSLAEDGVALADLASLMRLSSEVVRSLIGSLEVALPPGEVVVPIVGPEESAVFTIMTAAVAHAVAELPEAERAVVAATFGAETRGETSVRAVARSLGISPSTAADRLDRALARLRRRLGVTIERRRPEMPTTARPLTWPDYGFAIDVPNSWEVFPGARNTSNEIVRVKRDAAELSLTLIVWKAAAHGADTAAFASNIKEGLQAGGYSDFTIESIGSGHVLTARQADGWTTHQYYLGGGTAVYVLGWGTPDLAADQGDIDNIVSTFRLLQ